MQTNRSWLPLLIGVLFCTFVGGGVRVLLAPEVVAKWVHSLAEKKQTRFYFQFNKAQISLASGWRPHLAIELNDVEFGAKDPCVSSSKLTTDQLIVPLKVAALFESRIQFGHVQVGRLNINLREREAASNCPQDTSHAGGDLSAEIQNIEKFLSTRWKKEINNTLRYLTEFSVQNLRFIVNDQIEPQFQAEDLNLHFDQKSGVGHAEFIFWPGFYWSAGQPFGPTQIQIEVSEQDIAWKGAGNLKEGQIQFSGLWQIEKSVLSSRLNWTDVPVSNLITLIDRWGLVNIQEFKPLHQWSTCTVATEGSVRSWRNLKFELDNCISKGDLGEYSFTSEGLYLARAEAFPLEMSFSKVNVKAVLGAFGFPLFHNLSHYGTAHGRLKWSEKNRWEAEGDVESAEVFISLLDPNHRLEVGPAQFEVRYKDGHALGQVQSANALGLAAQAGLQFEKQASSDVVNLTFNLDIGQQSGAFKKFNIFPYREMKLNLQAKTDYHEFYNVKGSIVLNDVVFNKNDVFYPVANHLARVHLVTGEESTPIQIGHSESRFAVMDNNNLFAEGRFEISRGEKREPFTYEVLLQDRKFESGKIKSVLTGSRGTVYRLHGSLQEPQIQ